MGLEQEIHQSKFRNERQKAIVNLIYTHNWLMEQLKAHFSRFDITPQQYNILRILNGAREPISTCVIRERMLDKMSDVSRIVDRLVLRGLVDKHVNPRDRRLLEVKLTEKGRQLVEEMDSCNEELDAIACGLDDKDAVALSLLLDKIREPAT